jgi:hypothetical protein
MEELVNYYKENAKYNIPVDGDVYLFSFEINGNSRKKIANDFSCFASIIGSFDEKCVTITMGKPDTNIEDYTELAMFSNVVAEEYPQDEEI